jgi:hypothetical protein
MGALQSTDSILESVSLRPAERRLVEKLKGAQQYTRKPLEGTTQKNSLRCSTTAHPAPHYLGV